jgi:hypothetical protein
MGCVLAKKGEVEGGILSAIRYHYAFPIPVFSPLLS